MSIVLLVIINYAKTKFHYNTQHIDQVLLLLLLLSRTASHTTKYIHQRDSPLMRLLGGEGTIPKSTQYVTVVTDTTQ